MPQGLVLAVNLKSEFSVTLVTSTRPDCQISKCRTWARTSHPSGSRQSGPSIESPRPWR